MLNCELQHLAMLAVGSIDMLAPELNKYSQAPSIAAVGKPGALCCTEQPEGRGRAGAGHGAEGLDASPVEQERRVTVMVVQPDDTVTVACSLAGSPKQPEVQVCVHRSASRVPLFHTLLRALCPGTRPVMA